MQEIKKAFSGSHDFKHSLDAEDFPKSRPYSDIYSANPSQGLSNMGPKTEPALLEFIFPVGDGQ